MLTIPHLPLPPRPLNLLRQASLRLVSESPPVSEVPAICSRKPGQEETTRTNATRPIQSGASFHS